jgi:hypothetical protein
MIVTIVLRIVHILAGVFWAGSTFFLVGFISRTAGAAGEAGGRFMERLMTQTRFPAALGISGGLTILAGLALYGMDSRFSAAWMTSPTGLTFGIAGLAAILSLPVGALAAPSGRKLGELSRRVEASGAPATAEQVAEIDVLRQRIARASGVGAVLLVIAVVGMAIARYV